MAKAHGGTSQSFGGGGGFEGAIPTDHTQKSRKFEKSPKSRTPKSVRDLPHGILTPQVCFRSTPQLVKCPAPNAFPSRSGPLSHGRVRNTKLHSFMYLFQPCVFSNTQLSSTNHSIAMQGLVICLPTCQILGGPFIFVSNPGGLHKTQGIDFVRQGNDVPHPLHLRGVGTVCQIGILTRKPCTFIVQNRRRHFGTAKRRKEF